MAKVIWYLLCARHETESIVRYARHGVRWLIYDSEREIRSLFDAHVRISMFASVAHCGIVSHVQRQLSNQQLRS